MSKQSLFISYCWKDGNTYADELETQLKDEFIVKRDKSQLIPNDDINDFMAEIANCDNVIVVLTAEYVKSLNCMLEMSYLVSQEDWPQKSMILVIDESIYSTERKLEIINYWQLRQKKIPAFMESESTGTAIIEAEKQNFDDICDKVEKFLLGISRRKNPSQIAVVNEIIKKSKRNRTEERELVSKGEQLVLKVLQENGNMNLRELTEKTGISRASAVRYVSNLMNKRMLERVGSAKNGIWKVVQE